MGSSIRDTCIVGPVEGDATCSWAWPERYDFFETTRMLRTGGNDPTVRREPEGLWRTARLREGPVTVRIRARPKECIEARAWGPAAEAGLQCVPRWLGLHEKPWSLPSHPVTDRLLRDFPGVRLTDTNDVYEALVNTVLQQQITWQEAAFTWRRLVEELGEPAPGPAGLRLVPIPASIRSAGVAGLVQLGIGRQRAATLSEVAFAATRLQRAAELPTTEAMQLLQRVRGVGPWTAAVVLGMRLARPEPLVLGDVHLPHAVCWALAGEARGSEKRMQELLEPFADKAFLVVRLLHAARIEAPRRAPRRELRFGHRQARRGLARGCG